MIRRIVLATFLALGAAAAPGFGCSCARSGEFFRPAGGHEVVFLGRPVEYIFMEGFPTAPVMVVAVDRVLAGVYRKKTIRIWGDNGMSCVPYVTSFPLQTSWVFRVGGPQAFPGYGDENYGFAPCSTEWLRVIEGRALVSTRGAETGTARVADLPRLLQKLPPGNAWITPLSKSFPRPGAGIVPPRSALDRPEASPECKGPRTYTFEAVIGNDGRVAYQRWSDPEAAKVARSVEDLDHCSFAAARRLHAARFEPATREGRPLAVLHRVRVAMRAP